MRIIHGLLFFLLLLPGAASAQLIRLQSTIGSGFGRAIEFQQIPNRPRRVALAYQDGFIRVFNLNTPSVAPVVMLNMTALTNAEGEQGLLGLAFHPKFPRVNKIYVNYTNNAGSPRPALATVIASFNVDTTTLIATLASRVQILTFPQPFTNHNGGKVEFGPDGKLYVASGDGGSSNDPQNNSQRKVNLLGKILRIDVDSLDTGLAYGIPRTNPFYDSTSTTIRKEIYAFGLRNPWRFSWDMPTKRLWVGDVGQNQFEEVDTVISGGNYGWKIREGYTCLTSPTVCNTRRDLIKPVHVYNRAGGNVSITGGVVYRGSDVPYLYGKYIYADYASGRIWALEFAGDTLMRNTELMDTPYNVSSFGVDDSSEVYVLSYTTGATFKVQPDPTALKGTFGTSGMVRTYPNPAKDLIKVEVDMPKAADATILLLSLTGEEVQTLVPIQKLPAGKSTWSTRLKGVAAGTYLLRVQSGHDMLTRRVVVAD